MKVLFAFMLMFTNWYYIPKDSPAVPVKVESIDLKLKSDELAMTFFSLSSGEASLIHHGNDQNILINTGGQGTEPELKKLLKLYGANEISTIILTDEELYNETSLVWLIEEYGVKQVIAGETLASQLKHGNTDLSDINIHIWSMDTKQQLLPGLQTEVLYNGNDSGDGMDVSFTFARHRVFFMNSTSEKAKEVFLKKDLSNVNILKLPAFGREKSISEDMIKHMDPQIAILFHKSSVKPDSDLFGLLNDAWVDVYYTRKHGTVTIKFTDINYEVITIFQEDVYK
ncbi:ATP-dependent DNA helicase [Bacillus sp. J33]|uniref:ATP-dependent DNA helicase n=1 Tax=Bacillus sp. J33 TaxID=935836 RepID=UPI00047D9AC6|nr:ATP-dependent DNA helicase [Bacillus sp. J33]